MTSFLAKKVKIIVVFSYKNIDDNCRRYIMKSIKITDASQIKEIYINGVRAFGSHENMYYGGGQTIKESNLNAEICLVRKDGSKEIIKDVYAVNAWILSIEDNYVFIKVHEWILIEA